MLGMRVRARTRAKRNAEDDMMNTSNGIRCAGLSVVREVRVCRYHSLGTMERNFVFLRISEQPPQRSGRNSFPGPEFTAGGHGVPRLRDAQDDAG